MGGKNRLKEKFFKTNRKRDGGTLKIFVDQINPTLLFKTLLLSVNDPVRWIIKEMLEKCGLKHENPQNYCLVQIIVPPQDQWESQLQPIKQTILRDDDCPYQLWLNHFAMNQGSPIVFQLQRRSSASAIDVQEPLLIEVDAEGHSLPMPRLIKILPNETFLGREQNISSDEQYIHIDGPEIDRNHGTLQNQNGTVVFIPQGQIYRDGKQMRTPWILQHNSLIRFGSNVTFRYYDPAVVKRIQSIRTDHRAEQTMTRSMYSSLPILTVKSKVNVLPGLLDVPINVQSTFLQAVFNQYPLSTILFRLSPVYTLYMALRYRLSPWVNPHLSSVEKHEDLLRFLSDIEAMINDTLEVCHNHIGYVTYWLANLSEYLYFLKQDRDLKKISEAMQTRLIARLQQLFEHLIDLLRNEIEKLAPALINDHRVTEETNSTEENLFESHWAWLKLSRSQAHSVTMKTFLNILSSLMALLRKCRVNATLTIQIFSHLFLSINSWLFNRIVCSTELNLCSIESAVKMSSRLIKLRQWTEEQGLELIFDYHLLQVNQLCSLLFNPKRTHLDAQHLLDDQSWKINSLQIQNVLQKYQPAKNEMPISSPFVHSLIITAAQQIDEKLRREGIPIQLAEDTHARLLFVVPEDGYTCEHLQGIPHGLLEFIDRYIRAIPCRLFVHPNSLGYWTEFMSKSHLVENNTVTTHRLETIKLKKKDKSLGLSIVAAKSESQSSQGIYIREIVPNGPAEQDGRLQPGDQLLAVDKMSLIDVTQDQAADMLRKCGSTVTLQVLKNAAFHQGISSLITRPIDDSYQPYTHFPQTLLQTPILAPSLAPTVMKSPVSRSQSVSQTKPPIPSPTRLNNANSLKPYQSHPNLSATSPKPFPIVPDFQTPTKPAQRSIVDQVQPVISREDVPTTSTATITNAFITPKLITPAQRTQSVNYVSTPSGLSKAHFQSTPLRVVPSLREKPRSTPSTKVYEYSIDEKRAKRIHDLITKLNRSTEEEKELKRLRLEDEFERRFGQLKIPSFEEHNRTASSASLTDDMKEFDDRLKRRLEQFEEERAMERVYLSQMLAKRQTDIERRLRLDRERAIRADRDMEEFRTRHLKEEEQILEAKREQARLLKHMHLPKSKEHEYRSIILTSQERTATSPYRKH